MKNRFYRCVFQTLCFALLCRPQRERVPRAGQVLCHFLLFFILSPSFHFLGNSSLSCKTGLSCTFPSGTLIDSPSGHSLGGTQSTHKYVLYAHTCTCMCTSSNTQTHTDTDTDTHTHTQKSSQPPKGCFSRLWIPERSFVFVCCRGKRNLSSVKTLANYRTQIILYTYTHHTHTHTHTQSGQESSGEREHVLLLESSFHLQSGLILPLRNIRITV